MKYAVYVEGQSEMLFVAHILTLVSGYDSQKYGYTCLNLKSDGYTNLSHPTQGDENSENYFLIVNVNNDSRVNSELKKNIPRLINNGYDVIIGLRDVYGTAYENLSEKTRTIDRALIEEMHTKQSMVFQDGEHDIRLHFAIMEYETWMLALLKNYMAQKERDLSEMLNRIGIDPACDFEKFIYHPSVKVKELYQLIGKEYDKHEKDSFSFLETVTLDDLKTLIESGKCQSFAKFYNSLTGQDCPDLP